MTHLAQKSPPFQVSSIFLLTCSISIRHQKLCWMLQWIRKHNCGPQEAFNLTVFYTDLFFKTGAFGMTSVKPLPKFLCCWSSQACSWAGGEMLGNGSCYVLGRRWATYLGRQRHRTFVAQPPLFTQRCAQDLLRFGSSRWRTQSKFPGMSNCFCTNHNSTPFPLFVAAGHCAAEQPGWEQLPCVSSHSDLFIVLACCVNGCGTKQNRSFLYGPVRYV